MKRLLLIAMILLTAFSLSGCIIRDHRDGGRYDDRHDGSGHYNGGGDRHCDEHDSHCDDDHSHH